MRRRLATLSAGTAPLLGLMLAHFTNDLFANVLPSYLPVLREKFELTYTLTAILLSVFHTVGSFAQIGFGWLSDRWPQVRLGLIGPVVTGGFMSLVGILPSYVLILVALGLAAMGSAMFHPESAAHAGQLGGPRRGLVMSLFVAAGMLGFAVGPASMGLLIDQGGLGSSPWALGPLAVLMGTAVLLGRPREPQAAPDRTPSDETSSEPSGPAPSARRRALAVLWGLVVLRHTVHLGFLGFVVILLQERGATYLAGNLALFGFLTAAAIGGVLGGSLSDRWGRWPVTVATLWGGKALLLGFLVSDGTVAIAALWVGGGLLNASNPVVVAQAQELAPAQTGTASAVVMGLAWGVAGGLVNIVGVLADVWQDVGAALGAVTLGAFALTVLLSGRSGSSFARAGGLA